MFFSRAINRLLDDDKAMQKAFSLTLLIANLCYAFYLLSLGYYNRLAADDYNYLAEFQEHGFASPAQWYVKWQGRFSAQTFISLAFVLKNVFHSLLPYTILLSAIYIYSIRKILQVYLQRLDLKKYLSSFLVFNISVFIFLVFVASNFAFNTFFWINVSTMYFGGIAFALIGFSELISGSKMIISYIIIFISFIYVGASAEHHGAIACLFLGLGLLYMLWKYWKTHKINILHIATFQKMLLALAVCFIAFVIMILAPGNDVRRAYFPETSVIDTFKISARSTGVLLLHYIPSKIKFLFLLGFPMVYFGTIARRELHQNTDKKIAKYWLLLLPVFIFFLWICFLPNAYAQGDMGPMRAHTHIAFYLVALACVFGFLLGNKTQFPKPIAFVLALTSCVAFFASGLFSIVFDLPEAIKYSRSEDARIEKILQAKAENFQGTLVLDSLYQPKKNALQTEPVLFVNEIVADRNDSVNVWKNRALEWAFDLPFEVVVEK